MEFTCPCGGRFEAKRPNAKYCSSTCRTRANRAKAAAPVVQIRKPDEPSRRVETPADVVGGVERTTRRALEAADRLDTPLGQACVVLARRLDTPGIDTGSALQSVAGRLDELLTKATRGTGARTAPQVLADELAERRASRGGA